MLIGNNATQFTKTELHAVTLSRNDLFHQMMPPVIGRGYALAQGVRTRGLRRCRELSATVIPPIC